MAYNKKLKLSPEMEKALLAGVIFGAVTPESINVDELSEKARSVHQVVTDLLLTGQAPPLKLPAILLSLTEVHGVPRPAAQAYLESINASINAAEGVEAAVRKLREKHTLLTVLNAASGQLQKGEYNVEQLNQVISGVGTATAPRPLCDQIQDGMPPPPSRLPLRLLPLFSDRIGGGLVGLTVLAGEPAVGKSRIAWQIALDVNTSGTPVVYYDLDNGLPTLLERTSLIFGGDHKRIIDATQKLYLRDSIRTLDSDLVYVPPPALVVVDIFQALPVSQEYERQGLGHWIHRLGALRRRGYHVFVVSEVSRAFYGNAGLGSFKGSGEIEYTADLGLQMTPSGNGASINIVKNRHGALKGEVVTLYTERGVLWKETGEFSDFTPHSPVRASDFDKPW